MTPDGADLHRYLIAVRLQAIGKRDLAERQTRANATRPRFSPEQIVRDRSVAADLDECANWIAALIDKKRQEL